MKKISEKTKKEIRDLHLDGVSDYKIMKKLHVSQASVRKYGYQEDDKEWEERFCAEWEAAREAILR